MERRKTMRGETRLALLLTGLALAVVMALATNPNVASAAACTRESLDGEPRACTWSESLGECFKDVEDAYWQCRRRNQGFLGAIRCSFASNMDQVSCLISSGVFAISRPVLGG